MWHIKFYTAVHARQDQARSYVHDIIKYLQIILSMLAHLWRIVCIFLYCTTAIAYLSLNGFFIWHFRKHLHVKINMRINSEKWIPSIEYGHLHQDFHQQKLTDLISDQTSSVTTFNITLVDPHVAVDAQYIYIFFLFKRKFEHTGGLIRKTCILFINSRRSQFVRLSRTP